MFNILVIDDDKNIRRLYRDILADNGYNVFSAGNGSEALDIMDKQHIDLALVDVMMPGMDGLELTGELRKSGIDMPVLMITSKSGLDDIKKGLKSGADDYMVKPVDEEEMLLRIKSLLRRFKIASEKTVTVGSVTLDYSQFTVKFNGEELQLTKKEFMLLFKLLSNPDTVFTRLQLMDEIWGMDNISDMHTLDVHINRLRTRFKDCSDFEIITVRGLGYKAGVKK